MVIRNTKDLLIILLESIQKRESYLQCNLCKLIYNLKGNEIINIAEMFRLQDYLYDNRPIEAVFHNELEEGYWWDKFDKEPRIKWLKKQIEKHTE